MNICIFHRDGTKQGPIDPIASYASDVIPRIGETIRLSDDPDKHDADKFRVVEISHVISPSPEEWKSRHIVCDVFVEKLEPK